MTARALSYTDVVVLNEGLLTTEVDGEIIAMDLERGVCYGLNTVGTRVWELLAEPRSIESVCAQIDSEFDVAPDVCRREVAALVEALFENELARRVDG